MPELVVAKVMSSPALTVESGASFKEIVNLLLAGDADAVSIVDAEGRPLGLITDGDVIANLEFHGGYDPKPILGAGARLRWRKSTALCASELMGPAAIIAADARLSDAARRLADGGPSHLCVVDRAMHLVGTLTRRNLMIIYRRSDAQIEADIGMAIAGDLHRPARPPADVTIRVRDGVVVLQGVLRFRSQVEHARHTAARVPGVIIVRNSLTYELDDLLVTAF